MALSSADHAKMLLSFAARRRSWLPRTGCHRHTPFGAYLNSRLPGFHSRFGRGRGKGTARRSTTAICAGCVTNGVEDVKKATIGSSGADLRAAAALGIEPVSSSLVGTCLPPPLIFRTPLRSFGWSIYHLLTNRNELSHARNSHRARMRAWPPFGPCAAVEFTQYACGARSCRRECGRRSLRSHSDPVDWSSACQCGFRPRRRQP
jgi:hypothetical protein